MANLVTEAEVLHAGFQGDRVKTVTGLAERSRVVLLYFEYNGADLPALRQF